jgi:GNAT superfamily N-acetyltransferase
MAAPNPFSSPNFAAPTPLAIAVSAEDPAGAEALALVAELTATLTAITGDGGQASFDPADVRGPRACFALARGAHGRALGCGALRPLDAEVGELKRMFARPGTRGVGSAVLQFLEREAARHGYAALRLSTRRVNERAVAFYARHGYRRIDGYGHYVGSEVSVCFEKALHP